MIRSIRASAFVLVIGATALLPLTLASCEKVIGLPGEKPRYVGGAGGSVNASQACKDYCALATTTCMADPSTGLGKIYGTEDSCLTFCTTLEAEKYEFMVGDETTDPIACRARRLMDPEDKVASCAGGSPTGAAECGNMCELYCTLYSDICTETCENNRSLCTVPPEDACKRQCESLRVDGQTRSLRGGTYDQSANYDGDSLQCRFLHLVNAIMQPRAHCGHAAFNANSHCFDDPAVEGSVPLTCEAYCKVLVEGTCPVSGDFAVYESEKQCMAVCDAMTEAELLGASRDGAYNEDLEAPEDSPNTIGCRHTHSYFAFGFPEEHCSHAGPLGAPVCADPCESFCVLKQQACPSDPEQSEEACMTECARIEGANEPPDYTVADAKKGGDFNCRVLHLVRALELDADARAPECAIVAGTTRCPAE